jgi:alcohol dehydrogenase (cytochrome c)
MRLLQFALVAAALCVSQLPAPALNAQELSGAQLLHPAPDTWPQYHGDYSGRRHVHLTQINRQNVSSLTLAWAFQTDLPMEIKSSPVLVDGVLYFTVPEHVWAVDARNGHMIWHYKRPSKGEHIGQRGVAMYGKWLYIATPDAHLISLDARDGSLRWDKTIADVNIGYWSTVAPLVVGNHVIVGVGGDMDNLPGLLTSFDPDTGEMQWQWASTPPAGTPDGTTGGMTWITGTYDPELNLVYWGTGNPTPVLNGHVRPGDDAYTCSIVAIHPDTGKLAWGFVVSPHDTHDWDAVEVPVLVDGVFHGKPRKMLMQASRNGYFVVLDRTDGKNLLTVPFGPVNWASGIDAEGRPIPNPAKEPAPDGRLVAPDEGGLTNFRSPSFDPKTGLFIVDAHASYGIYFEKPADGNYGWAGADYDLWGKSMIEAIDYQTGKIRWSHDVGGGAGAGVITTDSGLTFTGDSDGNVLALDSSDGKTLWHAGMGRSVGNPPISYMLDGRQYILTGAGGVLFAWALPEGATSEKPATANRR